MGYYSNEKNVLILVSLLKSHGIKKIIVSPGTTNISFVVSVQNDPWFEVYSVVDERSAGFVACGLSDASGEPVVLSCTGATASRNYLPGLTEAFYRNLPILVVTFSQSLLRVESYSPQFVDRTVQFEDLVKMSLQVNPVLNSNDENNLITQINRAILELNHKTCGPVHINIWSNYQNSYTTTLPTFRTIKRYSLGMDLPSIQNKKIGIFVGAHQIFSEEEIQIIDLFCETNNSIVLCDQTSNYHGKFRFLPNLSNNQRKELSSKRFDLIIHIGSVSGSYLPLKMKEVWRVNSDGEVRDYFGRLTSVFEMKEVDFFKYYHGNHKDTSLFDKCVIERKNLLSKIPPLPFSNIWVAKNLSLDLPSKSVLCLAILNSLRAWNFFDIDNSIACFSNTGGFGIDGCLSSFIGAALNNPEKEFYGIFGDLSFFYDINSLSNNLPNNIHMIVVNNGIGVEFKNYNHNAASLGSAADMYIAAKGHNGNKSSTLLKNICKNNNITYLFANNKEEFLSCKNLWLTKQNNPVLCEIFTCDKDESDALYLINTIENSIKSRAKSIILRMPFVKRIIKILRKG